MAGSCSGNPGLLLVFQMLVNGLRTVSAWRSVGLLWKTTVKIDSAGSIEIRFSKRKLVLMLMGSIIFVILGLWYFLSPPKIPISILNNPVLIRVVGVTSILFFGFGFSILLKNWLISRPVSLLQAKDSAIIQAE